MQHQGVNSIYNILWIKSFERQHLLCPDSYPDLQGMHKIAKIWRLVIEFDLISFEPK